MRSNRSPSTTRALHTSNSTVLLIPIKTTNTSTTTNTTTHSHIHTHIHVGLAIVAALVLQNLSTSQSLQSPKTPPLATPTPSESDDCFPRRHGYRVLSQSRDCT